jgi:glycerophosphoryl diester phosphodiesterase
MRKEEFKNYLQLTRKNNRPPCIYHRAVSGQKNTNGLKRVIETLENKNVDGIEFDLQATSDGKIIVRHDFALKTNLGYKWIKELSFKQLRANINESDCPTFGVLVEAIGETNKIVDIEIKQPGIANKLINKYKKAKIYKQCIFTTMYEEIYKEILKSDPTVAWMYGYPQDRGKNLANRWWTQPIVKPAVLYIKQSLPKKIMKMMQIIPTDYFSFYHKVLSKELVENLHSNNRFVIGATINLNSDTGRKESLENMKKMLEFGIDLVKTDYPDLYPNAFKKN